MLLFYCKTCQSVGKIQFARDDDCKCSKSVVSPKGGKIVPRKDVVVFEIDNASFLDAIMHATKYLSVGFAARILSETSTLEELSK